MPGKRRQWLSGSPSGFGLLLLILQPQQRLSLLVDHGGARGEDRHQTGIGGERSQTRPGLGRRATPGRNDHADRNLLLLLEVTREKIGDSREVAHCVWGSARP